VRTIRRFFDEISVKVLSANHISFEPLRFDLNVLTEPRGGQRVSLDRRAGEAAKAES